ncbi:DNA gyrase subunit B [Thalassoglobus neptunius]|uniref:DNA topoisomerase (ATP-hydrolyzing) n=1 Tax=Thalassoglobus neptunius TaxID=1938619 RepID=A0A5C5X3H1_9PLAN|nr:DNA gyrase subunit B [Thalassoglobus neptunius]TWT57647.1 DNA gyrase subunit B [Thalassoglobus neptunius]
MSTSVKSNSDYMADDIEVLEGLEHVRKRPSMYIGGVDARGLHHLVWEIVDNCVDEYLAGECDQVKVTLHKDGCSISVEDNGRGIPVDKHKKTGKSALEVILTTLYAGGKFSDKNYVRSGGLHGIGSSAVNALSEEMVATVHRGGHEWRQSYQRGRPDGPVKKIKPFRGHGTIIFFRPDDQIFRRVQFHADTIRQHLEDISYIHGGLKITFVDETKGERFELHHPEGIAAFLQKLIKDEKRKAVHEVPFKADKDEGAIRVEMVLQWTESTDEQIRSYVNGIRTRGGGTHESGFRTGLAKAVKNYMDVHGIKPKGLNINPDDIREGVIGIVSVFHNDPMFQGQTKDRLNNPEMNSLVDGIVRPSVETWLNNNPSIADAVIGRIILAARARQASRDAIKEIKRKGPGAKRSNLPGKLLDCRSTDPEVCELFIVEGQSAGGTAASGRNSATQAVLPLRGKVLNTESLELNKIIKNQEISDLVETLGTGIGPHFDPHKLRYNRIILLMDADSDGYHISTLLLTFFFRHMRDLIQLGRLYLAQPPLYKIEFGKERLYARDDSDKEEILSSIPSNRTIDVQRFKGLGEMNASQLKETTLDPDSRTLLRVDIDSAVEADQTFAQLLGKDASERYRIIMDEAAEVDDIDV